MRNQAIEAAWAEVVAQNTPILVQRYHSLKIDKRAEVVFYEVLTNTGCTGAQDLTADSGVPLVGLHCPLALTC